MWLYIYIGMSTCILLPIVPLTAEVFGYTVSLSTLLWAPNFLATDILAEKYGKKAAHGGVLVHVLAPYLVILLVHSVLLFTPASGSTQIHQSISEVYQYSIKITVIGTLVYGMSQFLDIWIYDYLHKLTGEKFLWLRNNASTLFTTLFNNIAFWGLAVGSVLDNWLAIALAAYAVTVVVAICDTPFIYLAKKLTPLDMKQPNNLGDTVR
ncbi:MAG: queuosine precursor transporter [Alphaproteobacteria bacterium]|nr:queuosine precursor transporter [Alphaproteobacteria bacterium]MDD9919985.1 queuosine precursor transporter [Alphaproteobacteria bacterium]